MTTIAIIALCIYALDRIGVHAWQRRWQTMHVERFAVMSRRDELDIQHLERGRERSAWAIKALPGGLETFGKGDALAQIEVIRRMCQDGDLDDSIADIHKAARELREGLKKVAGDK